MKRFKIGNRVKYTSRSWADERVNPAWGGRYGQVKGTVDYVSLSSEAISVAWDNGTHNSYDNTDLELIGEQEQLNLF